MQPFTTHRGVAAPLIRPNVDTDAIIPSREMKLVSKTGLAGGLFANWRYIAVDDRVENPHFVLNQPRFRGASILVGGVNFGCGSSREHAVWALKEYGFRCIIAPSFGAIFYSNCVSNGLVPAIIPEAGCTRLAAAVERGEEPRLTIDLTSRTVLAPDGEISAFTIPVPEQAMLLEGLDPIGVTLKRRPEIAAFETTDRPRRPWLYRPSPMLRLLS
jgi:3-isopropylmalate/(R)-2-methylmalate dehydratase small subunit